MNRTDRTDGETRRRTPPTSTSRRARVVRPSACLLLCALAIGAAWAWAGPTFAIDDGPLLQPPTVTLRVRATATITGGEPTLGSVLAAEGDGQKLLDGIGAEPLATIGPGETRISLEQVRARLIELGVNPARVLLKGASACQVTVLPAQPPGPAPTSAASSVAPRNDSPAAPDAARLVADTTPAGDHADAARTAPHPERLSDRLVAYINGEMAALGGTAQVEFERASDRFLLLTTPPFQFTIRSADREKLGLREFIVTLTRDRTAQRTVRISARVQLVTPIVAAVRPLNVGAFVRPDDVRLEERIFETAEAIGVRDPALVVGQQVKRFVAPGGMVRCGDVRVADMVTRAQPVTVMVGGGAVAVRAAGVALDHGGFGDVVRVRLGEGQDRREIRGVVVGVGTVRVDGSAVEARPGPAARDVPGARGEGGRR